MNKYSKTCIAIADIISAHSKDHNETVYSAFWYAHLTMMNIMFAEGLISKHEYAVLDRYNDIMLYKRKLSNQVIVW